MFYCSRTHTSWKTEEGKDILNKYIALFNASGYDILNKYKDIFGLFINQENLKQRFKYALAKKQTKLKENDKYEDSLWDNRNKHKSLAQIHAR